MSFNKKLLSADGLYETIHDCIQKTPLPDDTKSKYSWTDCIMSGLAVFGLKASSLLQFEDLIANNPPITNNLKKLYKIQQIPSDTRLRERLDELSPSSLRLPFKKIFSNLQKSKILEQFKYLDGFYIVSVDGTGHYSSSKVSCKNCCEKQHRNGSMTYYHQMLGAAIVHPEHKAVIPFAPEPITKQDGNNKNDCESNASKRFLKLLRTEHPHLKMLIVEDSLSSNYPHLSLLDSLNMNYIIGAKPKDHKLLFDWVKAKGMNKYEFADDQGVEHYFEYYNQAPLNHANFDYKVNFLSYTQTNAKGRKVHFSWVTSLEIKEDNLYQIMRAGRSRWRIENETFNTLKNQGYNFEHNYGHGKKNLCTVMSMLLLLTFFVDQVQLLCCKKYIQAKNKRSRLSVLFETVRSYFGLFFLDSWDELYTSVGWNHNEMAQPPPMKMTL